MATTFSPAFDDLGNDNDTQTTHSQVLKLQYSYRDYSIELINTSQPDRQSRTINLVRLWYNTYKSRERDNSKTYRCKMRSRVLMRGVMMEHI